MQTTCKSSILIYNFIRNENILNNNGLRVTKLFILQNILKVYSIFYRFCQHKHSAILNDNMTGQKYKSGCRLRSDTITNLNSLMCKKIRNGLTPGSKICIYSYNES